MPRNIDCWFHTLACVFLVSSCGGGGSGAPPPSPPATNPPPPQQTIRELEFARVTTAGFDRRYALSFDGLKEARKLSGGVAAADYDADGDTDLYVVGGDSEPNHLYENQGDGTFVDVAPAVGLDFTHFGSGPAFGDIDGDGDLDLFVGGVEGSRYYLAENRNGSFVDVTFRAGINMNAANTISATFYDYDRDADLDLFLGHWGVERLVGDNPETLWRNNGDGTFADATVEAGLDEREFARGEDPSFTPNLADIDNDGLGDLLLTSDYTTSQFFVNNGDGTFDNITDRDVIVDQAGMGAAVGDYDNDGDMDWFVTSIHTLEGRNLGEPFFGNRLYRNIGSGLFEDVTLAAGVADGGWGWGSCAADFDNDGNLDIFHVNGWTPLAGIDFTVDQVRYFHGLGDASFDERAEEVGLDDTGQGRGVACFDAEGDGDIDLLITNNSEPHIAYYRNEVDNGNHYLTVRLESSTRNRLGIGAWITVTTALGAQVRELGGSNNYASHNPFEAHFGLGGAERADIEVRWPQGNVTVTRGSAVDQVITISD